MIHYQKETNAFIAQTVLFSVLLLFCLVMLFNLLVAVRYPNAKDLKYESCTYVSYEYKSVGKGSNQYFISVEEYDAPLVIDNIAESRVNKTFLQSLARGEMLEVSIEDKDEEQRLFVYEISAHGEYILSYEDYLLCHRSNERVGAVVNVVFLDNCGFLSCDRNRSL